jgi:hypothetical protein
LSSGISLASRHAVAEREAVDATIQISPESGAV